MQEAVTQEGVRLWIPLVDGADRVGVLGFTVDVDEVDDELRRYALHLGSLMAQFLISKGQYTDAYRTVSRRAGMSLAAEMQWNLLPPLTFTTRRVAIAGILEPAYDIGGDSFDYACNGDTVHLAIVDAMGHGLTATWPAAVSIGSIRHSRRRGVGLEGAYAAATGALESHFSGDIFVTAQLGEVDLTTGRLRWVNAGHPPPVLVRNGKVVGPLSLRPSLPLGLGGEVTEIGEFSLQPWDRLVFFTDGVIEGRGRRGEPFGEERLADVLSRETLAGRGPAETMRRVAHAVLAHHAHSLEDDFTLLFIEYRGPEEDVEEPPTAVRLERDTTG
jgi:serine phosphatase RsbU (regulator of sigma subunit)